jgi:outer membrane lipoprotein carrier protein
VLFLCLTAEGRELGEVLKGVEQRYNRAATLAMRFEQKYLQGGRAQRAETGELTLRKPGRMRWQYDQPAGKVFVSDGKYVWFYSPAENRAERGKLKAADDFRAPLAFLLGRLDFRRDFGNFEFKESGGEAQVVALPKSDRTPYTRVEFTVTADNVIRRLVVQGVDATVMEFVFTGERLNPALNDGLFRYAPPAGAEVVEVEQ